jgi:hypothetical protein
LFLICIWSDLSTERLRNLPRITLLEVAELKSKLRQSGLPAVVTLPIALY